ncbi:MAG: YkgJ family cysteine cluster protein [Candidatus Lokiarchaeota archaeon]|nr:YkgJ family cysteine cluster protein [Candidatus Lokiarchaeota archaeon]
MVDDKFWELVKNFNLLMSSAILGPDCISICHGDCCSIKINIPKILAQEYIKKGYATKEDFIRGDVFSFKLRFDDEKGKCFLYNKKITGCLVHNSGIKPPQCWIYPTKFSNPDNKEISCKRAKGWKIIDSEKTKEAERLLKYYTFLCQLEAKKELKEIKNRFNDNSSRNHLIKLLKITPPSQLAGFKDTWESISLLSAQGISLQMKKFCKKFNNKCGLNYLSCNSICDKVIQGLLDFLQQNLWKFVQKNGPDGEGAYPFFKLAEFFIN